MFSLCCKQKRTIGLVTNVLLLQVIISLKTKYSTFFSPSTMWILQSFWIKGLDDLLSLARVTAYVQ